jgi:hypothetical protein
VRQGAGSRTQKAVIWVHLSSTARKVKEAYLALQQRGDRVEDAVQHTHQHQLVLHRGKEATERKR